MGRAAAEFGGLEPAAMSLLHKLSEATAQGQQVHEFKPKSLIQLPLAAEKETRLAWMVGLLWNLAFMVMVYTSPTTGCTTMPFTAVMRAVVLG